jgi:predicted transglutaminase-like cysteine proteinase
MLMLGILARLALATTLAICIITSTEAAFYGFPRGVKPSATRIAFERPALAPMAFTRFCLAYPQDCAAKRIEFRPRAVRLTQERWTELVGVNRDVNRSIAPQRNSEGLRGERWLVAPRAGDCNDYAVTKRHELLTRDWPSRSLLLAEVATHWGEHHLVLVVRTNDGDFVLDNLNANVRPWSKTRYQWLRVQSPRNPNYWSTVAAAAV